MSKKRLEQVQTQCNDTILSLKYCKLMMEQSENKWWWYDDQNYKELTVIKKTNKLSLDQKSGGSRSPKSINICNNKKVNNLILWKDMSKRTMQLKSERKQKGSMYQLQILWKCSSSTDVPSIWQELFKVWNKPLWVSMQKPEACRCQKLTKDTEQFTTYTKMEKGGDRRVWCCRIKNFQLS